MIHQPDELMITDSDRFVADSIIAGYARLDAERDARRQAEMLEAITPPWLRDEPIQPSLLPEREPGSGPQEDL